MHDGDHHAVDSPMLCALCERRNFPRKAITGASVEEVAPETIQVRRLGARFRWYRSSRIYPVRC